nr:hypothetical protein [Neorhizobium lilium]
MGGWCQVAMQVRACGLPLLKSSFDWLVTPWNAVHEIMASDGDHFGLEADLDIAANSMRCRSYGVLYPHEFERDSDNVPVLTPGAMENCRSKLIYKHRKMVSTINEKQGSDILFVRYGGLAQECRAWPYMDDFGKCTEEDVNELLHSLKALFPQNRVKLLFVWADPFVKISIDSSKLHRDIFSRPLPVGLNATWEGDTTQWSDAFGQAFSQWGMDSVLSYQRALNVA